MPKLVPVYQPNKWADFFFSSLSVVGPLWSCKFPLRQSLGLASCNSFASHYYAGCNHLLKNVARRHRQLATTTTSMLNWIWDTWESVPYSHIKAAAHFTAATEYIYILWEQSRRLDCCTTEENAYGLRKIIMGLFLIYKRPPSPIVMMIAFWCFFWGIFWSSRMYAKN